MKFAYADPPYLGCGALYAKNHPHALFWDKAENYRYFILELHKRFPDGWALSCSTPSLKTLLPFCPDDARIAAWVKPFAIFKPNVPIAYAWEPVIFRGGRKRTRKEPTVRDWVSANITLKKGLTGAKPKEFCFWLFELLNIAPEDEFVDLFRGTGAVSDAFAEWRKTRCPPPPA